MRIPVELHYIIITDASANGDWLIVPCKTELDFGDGDPTVEWQYWQLQDVLNSS